MQAAAGKDLSSVFSCRSGGNGSAGIKLDLTSDYKFLLHVHILDDDAPLKFSGNWTLKSSLFYLYFHKNHDQKVITKLFPRKVNSVKMIKPHVGTFFKDVDKIDIWGVYCFKGKK